MLLQQLVNGLMLGSTYALIAIGYTLVFGVLHLVHLAHGEVFMIGAFAVLFSTTFSALAAWTRVFTDAAGKVGLIDFVDVNQRRRTVTLLAWFFPLAWATIFRLYEEPVYMVTLGGMGTAAILLVIVFAAINFRYRREQAEMRPGRFYDFALWVSIVAIVAVAIYVAQDGIRKWRHGKPAPPPAAVNDSCPGKVSPQRWKEPANWLTITESPSAKVDSPRPQPALLPLHFRSQSLDRST